MAFRFVTKIREGGGVIPILCGRPFGGGRGGWVGARSAYITWHNTSLPPPPVWDLRLNHFTRHAPAENPTTRSQRSRIARVLCLAGPRAPRAGSSRPFISGNGGRIQKLKNCLVHCVGQPRQKTQRSPFAAESSSAPKSLFAPPFLDAPSRRRDPVSPRRRPRCGPPQARPRTPSNRCIAQLGRSSLLLVAQVRPADVATT